MSNRGACVPVDRLTALALSVGAPESQHDHDLLVHVEKCEACAARLAELTTEMDALRMSAWAEADAAFDDAALDAQRLRILDRLSHVGQVARVLRFPSRVREAAMPGSPISRRWVSVAAAAGLIIGLVAGQLIHFVPWESRSRQTAASSQSAVASRGSAGPRIMHASSTLNGVTDEELLDRIDRAVQSSRAESLRALDALTPRVGEFVEIR